VTVISRTRIGCWYGIVIRSLRQGRVALPFGRVPSARVSRRLALGNRDRPVDDDGLLARCAVATADQHAGRRARGDYGTGLQSAVIADCRAEADRVARCRCSETDRAAIADRLDGRREADEQAGRCVEHGRPKPAGRGGDVGGRVAGLPAIGASPAAGGEPRAPAPPDALGVAASAGSAAAAATADTEAVALCGPGAVLSTRAAQQAGRQATVAIAKVDGSYQAGVRGQPTFLNDAPFPNHTFTVVIWGSNRRQFQPPPEGAWQGKALCVTGPVEIFQQRPQIVVSSPSQLRAAR
jgi:hypothetical protein